MAETSQFQLPLLSGSQAQKSVTVNEALSILDAVAQLRITSATIATPPSAVPDGEAFLVPANGAGAWFGEDGNIAVSINGGWRFVTPKAGWHAFNTETGTNQLFDGTAWLESTLAATSNGSATEYEIVETDHVLSAGQTSTTVNLIPKNAQVVGVTGRVLSEFSGSFGAWQLGVADAPDRFGQGLGKAKNSYVLGMSSSPTTYYLDTPLVLTAEGGDFDTGSVRLAVHFVTLQPPRAV